MPPRSAERSWRGGLFPPAPLRRMLERGIPFRLIEEAATPLRIVATRCERRADGAHSLRSIAAGLDPRARPAAGPRPPPAGRRAPAGAVARHPPPALPPPPRRPPQAGLSDHRPR